MTNISRKSNVKVLCALVPVFDRTVAELSTNTVVHAISYSQPSAGEPSVEMGGAQKTADEAIR